MPNIIYTDSLVGANGTLIDTSPAATYAVASLPNILDAIMRGQLECGTGVMYPIDTKSSPDEDPPWETGGPTSMGGWNQY